jgi:hypothetical protein
MLALRAYHQLRVHPRLREVSAGTGDPGTMARFRRSLRTEAACGLVALLLAAFLGITPPPGPAATDAGDPGFRHERAVDEARVRLEVTPLRPGPNVIRLTVSDPAGRPLADATAAIVQLVPTGGGLGPVTFSLGRTAPGVFVASEAVLGLVGRWDGRLVVQREARMT